MENTSPAVSDISKFQLRSHFSTPKRVVVPITINVQWKGAKISETKTDIVSSSAPRKATLSSSTLFAHTMKNVLCMPLASVTVQTTATSDAKDNADNIACSNYAAKNIYGHKETPATTNTGVGDDVEPPRVSYWVQWSGVKGICPTATSQQEQGCGDM
jgi:hypothetical protein